MLDAFLVADAVEDVVKDIFVVGVIGEVDAPFDCLPAVVAQDRIILQLRYGCDQVAQELGRDHLARLLMQLDKRKFAGGINRHEEAQLALGVRLMIRVLRCVGSFAGWKR